MTSVSASSIWNPKTYRQFWSATAQHTHQSLWQCRSQAESSTGRQPWQTQTPMDTCCQSVWLCSGPSLAATLAVLTAAGPQSRQRPFTKSPTFRLGVGSLPKKKKVSELVLKNVSVKWQANKKILNSEPTVEDIPSPGSIFFNHYWELSEKHHTPLCKKLRQLRKLEGSRINLIQHKNNYKKLILGTLDLVRQSQVSK